MKIITSSVFNMSERQAIFQYEENSFCEARSFQDKLKNVMGSFF